MLFFSILFRNIKKRLSKEEFASYNAPYPLRIYRGGIRAFPSMVTGIEMQNEPAYKALGKFKRPFMFIGGEKDRKQGSIENQNQWIAHVPGAKGQPHKRYKAGHFIQDDVGKELAEHLVSFLKATPIP